ncbi:MAG: HNH endonuclease [Patescibacteria group bacterium]|nr:HNH endonuclease [Patescibacteria group bacterium]
MQVAYAERSRKQFRTLVLNADFKPLSTWPLSLIDAEDAVKTIWLDKCNVIETWDAVFRSPSITIAVPKVIALRKYAPVNAEPKFCRRSILLRDRYCCQYCGKEFPSHELTFDHLIPRSRGGKTEWNNILSACMACNARKANNDANLSGRRGIVSGDGRLRPLKMPRRPTSAELLRAGLEFLPNDLRESFGDYLYWNVELKS